MAQVQRTTKSSQDSFHIRKISHFRLAVEILFVILFTIYVVIKKQIAKVVPTLRQTKIDFRNKVVLVTGAGGGFGRRLAERLAERGAIIACVDVDERANTRCVAAANRAATAAGGGSKTAAYAFRANLANREETQETVKKVEEKFGRIDVLISGAVCFTNYDVLDYDDDEIDFLVDLNFKSTVWLVRAVLPGMQKRGFGQIAVLSSVAGLCPTGSISIYAACKCALKGYMMSLHLELRKDPADVGVTVLYPFFSPTSPIIRELTTNRIPDLDPDAAVDGILEAIESREVTCVLPRYMSGLAGIHGLLPQESIDCLADLAGVKYFPKALPKATITVDKWVEVCPSIGPSGTIVAPHDGDEQIVVQGVQESRKVV